MHFLKAHLKSFRFFFQKQKMSLKSGYWYNKGEKFALYNFQGDEWNNKNMVCLDCPGIKTFMSGTVKHGDFGPAHETIIEATGVQNYNFCLASEVAGKDLF